MNVFLVSAEQFMPYVWIAFIVITAIIEVLTIDLVTLWFTVGAVGGLIASLCGAEIWLQFVIFIVISAACVIATRPLAKKIQKNEIIRTNSDKNIGKIAIVTKAFGDDEIGEVRIEERYWRAVSSDASNFEVDEKVQVDAISGTKVIVSKLDKKE